MPCWVRRKLAVLKDDEVDRLERASAAVTGLSRQDVMESMYNRLEPKPKGVPATTHASPVPCRSVFTLQQLVPLADERMLLRRAMRRWPGKA